MGYSRVQTYFPRFQFSFLSVWKKFC